MHTRKSIMFAALLGLSLFVLGLAVGQGLFLADPVHAQPQGAPYNGPAVIYFQIETDSAYVVDIDGYVWSAYGIHSDGPFWSRGAQLFPPNTPIPSGASSLGGLKGSYNK